MLGLGNAIATHPIAVHEVGVVITVELPVGGIDYKLGFDKFNWEDFSPPFDYVSTNLLDWEDKKP